MHRRRFLAVAGAGALGTLGGTRFVRSRDPAQTPEVEEDDDENQFEIEAPWSGTQQVVWSVDTRRPAVALTFDDGPDPAFTPRILDILDRHGVTATFMVLGYNAVMHQSLLQEVIAAGHEIGGHGWRHLNLAETTPEETAREVEYGIARVEDVAGAPIRLFRPPYGRFSEDTMKLLGHEKKDLVVWSVTRGELGWTDPRRVASHVAKSLRPGGIVDLHDGLGRGTFFPKAKFVEGLRRRRETEIRALPAMIESLQEKGYKLETVSDLMRTPDPGDGRA